jgi:hypothetical protein
MEIISFFPGKNKFLSFFVGKWKIISLSLDKGKYWKVGKSRDLLFLNR